MRNLIFDVHNLYSRVKYTINDPDTFIMRGLLAHGVLNMIQESTRRFKPDNIILMCDGKGSWRKLVFPTYKANRSQKEKTPKEEVRDNELSVFLHTELIPLLRDETSVAVCQADMLEADDLIATFIYMHPSDENIICSTDGDFIQLLTNEKTMIYNSMSERLITKNGIFETKKNKPIRFEIKSGKITIDKDDMFLAEGETPIPHERWVEYMLFQKCVRGDTSDNIPSAYPRITDKSTTKKVGVKEAFEDTNFARNVFMHTEWDDVVGVKHIVGQDFMRNEFLVDLRKLPDDLRNQAAQEITNQCAKPKPINAYSAMVKFLTKYELRRMAESFDGFSRYFTLGFKNES